MTTPALIRTVMPQGTTWQRRYTWKQNDTIVDLAGYTARMQIRDSYEAVAPAVSLTSDDGITLLSGLTQWHIALLVTEEQTRLLTIPTGGAVAYPARTIKVGDLELISAGGIVTRLIDFVFTVTREVTR